MVKNIRSSFFYFGARNINTVMKVRFGCATCCHPCLNVRSPYFIRIAREAYICLALLHGDHCNVVRSLHNKNGTVTHASQNSFFTT
jgi:hypothetical protein